MAKAAAIYLTGLSLTRLEDAANRTGSNSSLAGLVDDLITRTDVVPGNKVPADVMIMNSVVCVVDDTDAEREWMLVYPKEANVASARLSMLSPMDAALLGTRAGESVKYSAPNGAQRSLRINRVTFQPKAVDQHTL